MSHMLFRRGLPLVSEGYVPIPREQVLDQVVQALHHENYIDFTKDNIRKNTLQPLEIRFL